MLTVLQLEPEEEIRVIGFIAVLMILVILEKIIPAISKSIDQARSFRITTNVMLQGINGIMLMLIPLTLLSASLFALFNRVGLFNTEFIAEFHLGLWSKIIICWLLMDFAMYWLHRAYHGINLLWKIHCVHHGDTRVDITTTFRTHPFEIAITLLVRASIIIILGMPILGVVIYEIIVCTMGLLIHSNIRIHDRLEKIIRLIVITPTLHRIHHGPTPEDYQSNFGLVLLIWDRVFGTIRLENKQALQQFGLPELSSPDQQKIGYLLSQPLR